MTERNASFYPPKPWDMTFFNWPNRPIASPKQSAAESGNFPRQRSIHLKNWTSETWFFNWSPLQSRKYCCCWHQSNHNTIIVINQASRNNRGLLQSAAVFTDRDITKAEEFFVLWSLQNIRVNEPAKWRGTIRSARGKEKLSANFVNALFLEILEAYFTPEDSVDIWLGEKLERTSNGVWCYFSNNSFEEKSCFASYCELWYWKSTVTWFLRQYSNRCLTPLLG